MFKTSISVYLCSLWWCSTVDEFAQRNLIWVECMHSECRRENCPELISRSCFSRSRWESVRYLRTRMSLKYATVGTAHKWTLRAMTLLLCREMIFLLGARNDDFFNHQFLNAYLILFSYWSEKMTKTGNFFFSLSGKNWSPSHFSAQV